MRCDRLPGGEGLVTLPRLRAQPTRLLRVARRAETFPRGVTPHRTLEGSSTLLPSGSGVVMLGKGFTCMI